MGEIFIISGMPRARTAWVANYLTTGSVLCRHEALSYFQSPKACAEWLRAEAASRPAVGISDSGAVMFQSALAELLPEAKWVILRRTIPEVEASFKAEQEIEGLDLWAHKRMVETVIHQRSPLVVDFEQINDRIEEIAAYCVPGWQPDSTRQEMLLTLDVQLTRQGLQSGIIRGLASGILAEVEPPYLSPEKRRVMEIMQEALAVNPAAWMFWNELLECVDIYDHTIDHDGRDVAKTHRAFKAMWLSWPINGFMRQYAHVMVPVLSAAVSAWEHGGRAKCADIYTETANAMIFLLHGQAGVERWMPELRRSHLALFSEAKRKGED